MAKLTINQKIELYNRRKRGEKVTDLCRIFGIRRSNVNYLISLIDTHGTDILRKDKNKKHSSEFKLQTINRVLINYEAVNSVAIDVGLVSPGMLCNWIRNYKENGYNVIEKKRGKLSMTKPKNNKSSDLSSKETVKSLEERIQYLEAENEYFKKLDVVVKQRVEREKKKK